MVPVPSFNDVVAGSSADSSCVQQIIDALKGTAGQGVPISITAVNDAANWALDVQNDEAVNSRAFRVSNAAGGALIQADVNGVTLNQVNVSSGTITGSTITNSRLTNASVSTASPGQLMALLDSTTLASSAATMTLTVTSSAYAALQLVISARTDALVAADSVRLQYNGSTTAVYHNQAMLTSAAVSTGQESAGSTAARAADIPGSSGTNGALFGNASLIITDYASPAKWKMGVSHSLMATSTGTGTAILTNIGHVWESTAPITSIVLFPLTGQFTAGSRASLYGMP